MFTPVRELLIGVGVLLRGFGLIVRRPKLFVLGAIPPLITSVLFLAVLVTLLMNIEDIVTWMTPFAADWDEILRSAVRVAVGIALVAALVLLMVVSFTGVTLALGFPLYDKIAEDVEDELGDAPPKVEEPVVASAARAVRQSLTLIMISVLVTIPLFFLGFIPMVGQLVVPVISAVFGGWILCIELVGTAFDRRGLRMLADRRRHMQLHRFRALGFAIPCYLLLAIPFVAVVVFPAATAGGTVLARQLVDTASRQVSQGPPPSQL
ncbi:EI24 domain-containing protein [Salinactinospora qingdaonensis]|uniref:Sulfate transporter CysZ n=1 Tax=Salinactinospora qingdaonensis TaxID=702744 RepID=A0ABP7FPV2_9ACTN